MKPESQNFIVLLDTYKFKADTLRIFAISCMSPSGIFVLNLLVDCNYQMNWFLALRIFSCIVFFVIGLMIQLHALDIMEKRDRMIKKHEYESDDE